MPRAESKLQWETILETAYEIARGGCYAADVEDVYYKECTEVGLTRPESEQLLKDIHFWRWSLSTAELLDLVDLIVAGCQDGNHREP